MDRDTPPNSNHPWSKLSTVTTFDRGSDTTPTLRLGDANEVQADTQLVRHIMPTSFLIESLINLLCTLLEKDTKSRNKLYYIICDKLYELNIIDRSYNMRELDIQRGQYQQAIYKLVKFARAAAGCDTVLDGLSLQMSELCRYHREFEELSCIGTGAFGNVYKVLHRLDGMQYAVKKIILEDDGFKIINELNEVKTLAKLNHPNIVSYKGAWIEPKLSSTNVRSLPPAEVCDQSNAQPVGRSRHRQFYASRNYEILNRDNHENSQSNCSNENDNRYISNSASKIASYRTGMYNVSDRKQQGGRHGCAGGYTFSQSIINERFNEFHSSTNIIGERIVERNNSHRIRIETNSDVVSVRNRRYTNSANNNDNVRYADTSDSFEESASDQRIYLSGLPANKQCATLHIQMSLCDKTLYQWLIDRTKGTREADVMMMFSQLVSGVEYIHKQGIVHHDIKPSNIFLSMPGPQIQLGDFGLACFLRKEEQHDECGTPMYAAPEQRKGKCDPQSDIYSMGIVLIELLIPMHTCMERTRKIEHLKNGKTLNELAIYHTKWTELISCLLQEDPAQRPTASQLLQKINCDKDAKIARLESETHMKDNKIEDLLREVSLLKNQMRRHNS